MTSFAFFYGGPGYWGRILFILLSLAALALHTASPLVPKKAAPVVVDGLSQIETPRPGISGNLMATFFLFFMAFLVYNEAMKIGWWYGDHYDAGVNVAVFLATPFALMALEYALLLFVKVPVGGMWLQGLAGILLLHAGVSWYFIFNNS